MGKGEKKYRQKLQETKVLKGELKRRAEERDMLLNEEEGFLQPDEGEKTLKLRQDQLKPILQKDIIDSVFSLDLDHGPYCVDYTRNGQYVLLGGEKGHVSLIDWKKKDLVTEFKVKERVRDVKFLQGRQMFAVA